MFDLPKWLLLGLLPAAGYAFGATLTPAFSTPAFLPSSNNACHAAATSATPTPDGKTLSILRSEKFLLAGGGVKQRRKAACVIDLPFKTPSKAVAVLHVDVRGSEQKDVGVTVDYGIGLGSDVHRFRYQSGRLIRAGDAEAAFSRSFRVTVPAGSSKLRLTLSGSAKVRRADAAGHVAIDSIDICVIDPDVPDGCGADQPAPPGH